MILQSRSRSRGFTLVELLVVISIILIVSAGALSVIIPALNSQGVTTAALLVQAELSRARDEAVRANEPRGIRLVPEQSGPFAWNGATPAYTRMIALEPGGDYSEGLLRGVILPAPPLFLVNSTIVPPYSDFAVVGLPYGTALGPNTTVGNRTLWATLWETKFTFVIPDSNNPPNPVAGVPAPPTSWFWNVRKGDKIRVGDGGRELIIVGPDPIGPLPNSNFSGLANPEGYVNWGPPTNTNTSYPSATVNTTTPPSPVREFLIVLDGLDNDGDGYVDEAFDGIDNDGDGITDPLFNGIDDNGNGLVDDPSEFTIGEWEPETLPRLPALNLMAPNLYVAASNHAQGTSYTLSRRPVPARQAREVALPSGVAIDMTSWNQAPLSRWERSRLPIDPSTGFIDIMVAPNGQLVQPVAGRIEAIPASYPYYHFWLTDIEDIIEPNVGSLPLLPFPVNTPGFTPTNTERVLKGNRRLISVNTRTGQISRSTLETFDLTGLTAATAELVIGRPFRRAEAGIKDEP